jgi:hypothetical protein
MPTGQLLMLAWLCLIVLTIVWSIALGLRKSEDGQQAAPWWFQYPLLVIPIAPTLVFLITAYFLLHAHPTAQFNAGNSSAGEYWSMWVKLWPVVAFVSLVQIPVYLIGFAVALAIRPARPLCIALGFALAAAAWGTYLVGLAAPSA